MFDTLDDQMKRDDQAGSSATARMIPWALAVVATVVVMGGLYVAIRVMGG
jgi:hypothetical protein